MEILVILLLLLKSFFFFYEREKLRKRGLDNFRTSVGRFPSIEHKYELDAFN